MKCHQAETYFVMSSHVTAELPHGTVVPLQLAQRCSTCVCAVQIEPVYKFYTSLREQRPESDMAKKWYKCTDANALLPHAYCPVALQCIC